LLGAIFILERSFVFQLYYLPDFTCVIYAFRLLRKLLGYGKFACDRNVIMELSNTMQYAWLVRGLKTDTPVRHRILHRT